MASPSLFGVGTYAFATGSITPTLPANLVEGHFLVLAFEMAGDQAIDSGPSGWTLLATESPDPGSGVGNNMSVGVYYRVVDASFAASPVDPTITGTNGSRHLVGNIAAFADVNVDDPFSGTFQQDSSTTGNTTIDYCPDITTDVDGALVVAAIACGDFALEDPFFTDWACPALTDFTAFFEAGTTSGSDGVVALVGGVMATAGLVDMRNQIAPGQTAPYLATCATAEREASIIFALQGGAAASGGGGASLSASGGPLAGPGQLLST